MSEVAGQVDRRFVFDNLNRVHVSYFLDPMARWISEMSPEGFRYTCRLLTGTRFESLILEEHNKKSLNLTDPILRELVEETIAKSHRQWRSIPETAVLVLKAIEDYGVGK